jgi:hypothetical protein
MIHFFCYQKGKSWAMIANDWAKFPVLAPNLKAPPIGSMISVVVFPIFYQAGAQNWDFQTIVKTQPHISFI